MKLTEKGFATIKPIRVEATVDPEKLSAHLIEFYGEAPVYHAKGGDIERIKAQARKICDRMRELGVDNFEALMKHFESIPDNILIARQIKEAMETIFYKVSTADNPKELAAQYKDRQFACGPGTLTNLQSIVSELSLSERDLIALGGVDLSAYAALAKQNLMEQCAATVLKQSYAEGKYSDLFWERGGIDAEKRYAENEIHRVSSVLNAVAQILGIREKPAKEDPYLVDITRKAPGLKEHFLQTMKEKLDSPEVAATFIENIVGAVVGNLPAFKDTEATTFGTKISAMISALGLDEQLNTTSLLEFADDGYTVTGYKQNVQSILKYAIVLKLAGDGVISAPYQMGLMQLCLEKAKGEEVPKEKFQAEVTKAITDIVNSEAISYEAKAASITQVLELANQLETGVTDRLAIETIITERLRSATESQQIEFISSLMKSQAKSTGVPHIFQTVEDYPVSQGVIKKSEVKVALDRAAEEAPRVAIVDATVGTMIKFVEDAGSKKALVAIAAIEAAMNCATLQKLEVHPMLMEVAVPALLKATIDGTEHTDKRTLSTEVIEQISKILEQAPSNLRVSMVKGLMHYISVAAEDMKEPMLSALAKKAPMRLLLGDAAQCVMLTNAFVGFNPESEVNACIMGLCTLGLGAGAMMFLHNTSPGLPPDPSDAESFGKDPSLGMFGAVGAAVGAAGGYALACGLHGATNVAKGVTHSVKQAYDLGVGGMLRRRLRDVATKVGTATAAVLPEVPGTRRAARLHAHASKLGNRR